MNIKKAYRSLQRVAQQQGITIEQVIEDINEVIQIGMANPDPVVKARWDLIPRVGNAPTAVELVAYLGELMLSDFSES